jgi:hypothetical protein
MVWSTSFRESFSVVPSGKKIDADVDRFLNSHGIPAADVLAAWPVDQARSQARGGEGVIADPKRLRAMDQLLRTVGLAYIDSPPPGMGAPVRTVFVTPFGQALRRWRADGINVHNARVIARHASRALAAAQLRTPGGEGKYAENVHVFPFSFIWRAMLALDLRISSDELNRAIYSTASEADLVSAIQKVKDSRRSGNLDDMGPEQAAGDGKNDRVLIWMAWASFGWTLIKGKGSSHAYPNCYCITEKWAIQMLEEAASIKHKHRDFVSVREYVEFLSGCAGVPPDLRSPT